MNAISLSYVDLALASLLVVGLALLFRGLRLGLSGQLLVAAGRMVAQLTAIGYVLRYLFAAGRPWLVALMALLMLAVASREIVARQKRKLRGWSSWRLGTLSLSVSTFAVALFGLIAVVQPEPWYAPQYAIPLLGMIMSNAMNAVSLGMDRLTGAIYQGRAVIEQRLALGQTAREAIDGHVRDCLRSGLTPVINSMATAGIVALPGMMTGQILAGAEPVEAVKYQILIWFLIAGGSGFGLALSVRLLQRRLFDDRDRLRLDRLR